MKRSRDEAENDLETSPSIPQPDSPASLPEVGSKIVHLSKEDSSPPAELISCSLAGHPQLYFADYDEYERHYSQSHLWKCSVCRRNFPLEHYLSLHIQECHDSITQVRKERGEKIYACFVEDCDRKCSAPYKRQLHMIDKHLFPKDFDFNIIRTGIDRRSSLLKSGRPVKRDQLGGGREATDGNSIGPKHPNDGELETQLAAEPKQEDKMDVDDQPVVSSTSSVVTKPDVEMDDLARAMSSLKFVPPSVRFGRGGGQVKGRGGLSKG